MRPTLRYGSRGDAVVELQKGLNLLASKLAPLAGPPRAAGQLQLLLDHL